jgi:hypothetical protein
MIFSALLTTQIVSIVVLPAESRHDVGMSGQTAQRIFEATPDVPIRDERLDMAA